MSEPGVSEALCHEHKQAKNWNWCLRGCLTKQFPETDCFRFAGRRTDSAFSFYFKLFSSFFVVVFSFPIYPKEIVAIEPDFLICIDEQDYIKSKDSSLTNVHTKLRKSKIIDKEEIHEINEEKQKQKEWENIES